MNPDTRMFELVTAETPAEWAVFIVGEMLPIKGWWWRVESCEGSKLVLRVHEPTSKRERP